MGSSGNQQQLVGQQKAQKGWLSRWTRKQWSRHWFVLKNGSLTYYRGPAAELCSFLDGVLDLSLIKHIEVPQQEEQVVLGHQHLNHHHQNYHHQNYHHLSHHQINPSPLVNFNGASQQQQPQHNHHQQQQQHLQQHQEHQQQHFNFSLKMWNGECHLLSASSASERQLWLAAINSCNNYDDETASSDSSSSSQSSNISTKSADIGSSHHSSSCLVVPTALHQPSLPLTPSSPSPPAAAAQLITTNNRETANRTSLANTEPSLTYQQKLDKEAEASLEQFALKLKSVVRRRRDVDNDPMDPTDGFQEQAPQQEQQQQATKQQASLITRQHPMNPSQKSLNSNQSNPTSQHQQQHTKQVPAIQAKGNLTIEKPKTDLICLDGQLEPANKEHANEKEQVEEDEEQAHKRRLVCLHSPTSDLATGGQIVQVNESEKLSLGTTALNTASDESPERAEVEVEMRCLEETEEAEKTEDEEEEDNDDELSDEGGESSLSDCDDHSMDSSLYCRPRKLESTIGSCRTPSDLNQGPPEVGQQQQQQQQRQKKRVTFDLSNQNIKSIPAATSSDDEEDDQEDKARDNDDNDEDEDDEEDEEDDDETTTTLSSASGSNSEGDDEDDEKEEDENDEDDNETEPRISSNCANSRVLLPTEGETLVPGSPGGSVDTERRHLLESAGIKRIEMRRRLELREQLRYSKQKSSYEDEDSTCELVRRMIERRKLRLQNKDGAVVGGKGTKECNNNNKENESSAANICQSGGAISSTKMETNQDDDEHNDPLAVVSVSVPPVSTKQTNQHDMNMNLNSLINQTDLLTKQLELEMRLKSAESNADLLEKRLNDSYLSYSQLEMSYKQLQLELNECRELNAKNMAQMQNKIDELTSKLKLSELELLEAKEKLLKHEQHLARWQLMNGNNQQQEQEAATASTQKPTLLTGTSQQQQQQQQQQQNEQQKCNPIRSSNNWLTKNYSNSVLMSTSTSTSGNKLLMNLANSLNQQQQQATPSKVIHQMRQSHSMRQQQLGLKLLSTSKQIQRKLNELELKVDKIQNGTANNNNNQQMLIDLNHEQQHLATANDHRQTTVAADSSSSSSNMANNGE